MKLTAKQLVAQVILAGVAIHIMLFGGSRSGKTFLLIRNIIFRALKAPGSRHLIVRFRFNHIKSSIIFDTFPKVMALAFPNVTWKLNKTDWFVSIPISIPDPDNPGKFKEVCSEIWFGGLDDKERTEKILGNEYATIYLCECSQISWNSRNIVVTRLAQLVVQVVKGIDGAPLVPRIYYDCNPPPKNHWTYLFFIKKIDPESRKALTTPEDVDFLQMNPKDNEENLPVGYIDKTLAGLSARMRARFLEGRFADANPNALFKDEDIDKWRVIDGAVPEFIRVVVGVDPSGADDDKKNPDVTNRDNDAIGIVVGALGTDGKAYLLEDCTVKAGPATWGRVATDAFDRRDGDTVVGEVNYGGAMVNHVIQTARRKTPFQAVTASRGKHIRAEPFSALYEQGKICHVGVFQDLEEELTSFSTVGYLGDRSPNRADAWIFVLAALFPSILSKANGPEPVVTVLPSLNPYARR